MTDEEREALRREDERVRAFVAWSMDQFRRRHPDRRKVQADRRDPSTLLERLQRKAAA